MDFEKIEKLVSKINNIMATSKNETSDKEIVIMTKEAKKLLVSQVNDMNFSGFDNVVYHINAALTSSPGKIDFSQKEVNKLRSTTQHNSDEFYKTALGDDKQFILFGDTNHTDTDIHEFFYSKENRERLVEMGVKHVFIEVEPEYQDIIDDCASSKLDTDEFIKAMQKRSKQLNPNAPKVKNNPIAKQRLAVMRTQAEALKYWHKNGVKTHCPDDRSNLKSSISSIEDTYALIFNALNYAKECGAKKPIATERVIISYLFNSAARKDDSAWKPKYPAKKNKMKDSIESKEAKEFMDKRMADDVKLSKTISDLAGSESAAILFGSGHGDRRNGLVDQIGKNKVVRVNLHSQIEHYAEKSSVFQREADKNRSDPDFIHILKDKKVYKSNGMRR